VKLAIVGAGGRMGMAILRLARAAGDIQLVGAYDGPASPHVGRDAGEVAQLGTVGVAISPDIGSALLGADVCIDFSTPQGTLEVARAAAREKVAWVCGTTGLEADGLRAIDQAAEKTPVLWAANMSAGIQVLAELVRDAVAKLGIGFDVEIVETHHRKKADAPSGTAKRLAEAVLEGRGGLREVRGREGLPGPRKPDELAVLALRGGDVIGDHTIHLLGEGERIELTHRATSRDLFAHGAIRAARFLTRKPAGRYTMSDVLAAAPAPELN
jgi:4-hydroxy-tetrahydrodipicolinate reductase